MTKQKAIINDEFPNGTLVDMTAEEETQLATDQTNATEEMSAKEVAREQLATDKASAKVKLIAGEALTEAEAATIVI